MLAGKRRPKAAGRRSVVVLVFGAVAGLAMASALSAQQIPKPLSTLSGAMNTGRIRCRGVSSGSYQATAFRPSSPVYLVRQPDLDNTAKQIRASALHTGNLKPGDKTNGAVWFECDSKARILLLRVPVGGVIYEFPLTFNR